MYGSRTRVRVRSDTAEVDKVLMRTGSDVFVHHTADLHEFNMNTAQADSVAALHYLSSHQKDRVKRLFFFSW